MKGLDFLIAAMEIIEFLEKNGNSNYFLQTHYGGVFGRHLFAVWNDSAGLSKFVVYSGSKDDEKLIWTIKKDIGMVSAIEANIKIMELDGEFQPKKELNSYEEEENESHNL